MGSCTLKRSRNQPSPFSLPRRHGFLPVIRSDGPAVLFRPLLQSCDDRFAAGAEVGRGDWQAQLRGLDRLAKAFEQRFQIFSLTAQDGHFDDDLGNEVCAVVKEVIFPQSGMAEVSIASGQFTPLVVQADRLVMTLR